MKQILISLLFLVVLYCLSTFVFDPAYLYYEIWWLDIPMHILGGFGLAFLTSAVLALREKKITYTRIVITYIIIALAWEVYEHVHNYISLGLWNGLRSPREDMIDTIKDLIDGLIGVSIAYLFIKK